MTRRAELTTAAALGVVAAFQAALALGAPWGRAAYGGGHPGVLPGRLRAVSAVSTTAYAGGALLNAVSRSPVERTLWTPLTAVAAVSAWRARPPA